jgi:hypothetical protein
MAPGRYAIDMQCSMGAEVTKNWNILKPSDELRELATRYIKMLYVSLLVPKNYSFFMLFDRSTASNNQAATLRGTIAGEAVFSDVEGESCWIIVNMRYECSLTNLDKLRCTKSVCIRKTHALSKLPLGAKHLKLWTTMPRCQGISWCTPLGSHWE